MYGSIPYITSLTESHSASVAWVNSASTEVKIDDYELGKLVKFRSESGALEFFTFSSTSR